MLKIKKILSETIQRVLCENELNDIDGDDVDWDDVSGWINKNLHYFRETYRNQKQVFNNIFWQHPDICYHATDKTNVEPILENGLVVADKTRGLTNRNVGSVIFTTTDNDQISYYGDYVFKINTIQMKQDDYKPKVEQEEDVIWANVASAIANHLDLEDFEYEIEQGMDYRTIIFTENIPKQYLTLI